MSATVRLTPAQRHGLELLACPHAEAAGAGASRWTVRARDALLGSVGRESLRALRLAGLVELVCGDVYPTETRQRITRRGRVYLLAQAPSGGAGEATP